MEPRQVDTELMQLLIKAVNNYQKIMSHYQVIQNAANLSDRAMGSDDISKKYRGANDIYDSIN